MPSHKEAETRERRIWGDLADITHPPAEGNPQIDHDIEIQEIPPPPGYRRPTHPGHRDVISGEEDPSASLSQDTSELQKNPSLPEAQKRAKKKALKRLRANRSAKSRNARIPPVRATTAAPKVPEEPTTENLTPRRRPRGPDVGKSIHKAAEASQASSSLSAIPQYRDRRRSVGRIVPSVISKDDTGRHISKSLAITLARKVLADPHSPSQWKLEAQARVEGDEANLGLAKESALGQGSDRASEDGSFALSRNDGSSYGNVDQRPLRSPSPLESAASTGYQVQLARKTCRQLVSESERIFRGRSSLPPQRIRAARKTSAAQAPLDFGSSGDSESGSSEEESNSEEEVPHSSSSSRHPFEEGSRTRELSPLYHEHRTSTSVFGARSTRNLSLSPDLNPPQALLSAFESISAYTVHLHTSKGLPFLLRNVRAGFRHWCQKLRFDLNCDPPLEHHHRPVALIFEYTDSSGGLHIYNTEAPKWECPLCSIFGDFPSCEALKTHVQWDHEEVEFEARKGENAPYDVESIIVKMREHHALHVDSTVDSKQEQEVAFLDMSLNKSPLPQIIPISIDGSPDFVGQINQPSHEEPEPLSDAAQENSVHAATSLWNGSQSQSHLDSSMPDSQLPTTSNETPDSRQAATPEQDIPPEMGVLHSPGPLRSSVIRSIPMSQPPLDGEFPETQSPPPPPLSNPHGPSLPVALQSANLLHNLTQLTTYRPTGPHLYDHLASLSLDIFGPRSWFVLDKEEEIFELTDVLDEDKVMCALWARWIILNRSFFISNYFLGVEAFVEEYWLMIHQAAGWGALRTWLLVLVSRRFLKNIEMVRILKQYNGLVGKDRWPKKGRDQ